MQVRALVEISERERKEIERKLEEAMKGGRIHRDFTGKTVTPERMSEAIDHCSVQAALVIGIPHDELCALGNSLRGEIKGGLTAPQPKG